MKLSTTIVRKLLLIRQQNPYHIWRSYWTSTTILFASNYKYPFLREERGAIDPFTCFLSVLHTLIRDKKEILSDDNPNVIVKHISENENFLLMIYMHEILARLKIRLHSCVYILFVLFPLQSGSTIQSQKRSLEHDLAQNLILNPISNLTRCS